MQTIGASLIAAMMIASTQAEGPRQMPAAPATAASEAHQPTGKWIVDFDDTMCVLQRGYGSKDEPLTLGFRPSPLGENISVAIIEKVRGRMSRSVPAVIRFGTGTTPTTVEMQVRDLHDRSVRLSLFNLKNGELEQALASGLIEVDAGTTFKTRFATPQLGQALEVLDDCVADLLATWGFSIAEQQRLASAPKAKRRIVNTDDYPSAALDNEEWGTNAARVTVSADGIPSKCILVESSGSKSLDEKLCHLLLKARFEPALDRSGRRMESPFFMRMSWYVDSAV